MTVEGEQTICVAFPAPIKDALAAEVVDDPAMSKMPLLTTYVFASRLIEQAFAGHAARIACITAVPSVAPTLCA